MALKEQHKTIGASVMPGLGWSHPQLWLGFCACVYSLPSGWSCCFCRRSSGSPWWAPGALLAYPCSHSLVVCWVCEASSRMFSSRSCSRSTDRHTPWCWAHTRSSSSTTIGMPERCYSKEGKSLQGDRVQWVTACIFNWRIIPLGLVFTVTMSYYLINMIFICWKVFCLEAKCKYVWKAI